MTPTGPSCQSDMDLTAPRPHSTAFLKSSLFLTTHLLFRASWQDLHHQKKRLRKSAREHFPLAQVRGRRRGVTVSTMTSSFYSTCRINPESKPRPEKRAYKRDSPEDYGIERRGGRVAYSVGNPITGANHLPTLAASAFRSTACTFARLRRTFEECHQHLQVLRASRSNQTSHVHVLSRS